MEFSIIDLLTLIGSLSLFLYGMKLMSEALQKVAGNKMRSILAAMTSNRIFGILTGVLVTAVIQASGATTVMLVSFVNAGLLSLAQAISVIMGANIGTTVTAWIISIFGFNFNIASIAVPLMALAMPLLFSKHNNKKNWGEVIMGFSLLFIGLEMLKNSVPNIKENPEILQFLSQYTDMGYLSVLLFIVIGTVLTIVVQSSSAMMAITLVMLAHGWMPFETAAAMCLGENIGTTITANIAAFSANISAKRTAIAHTVFNLIGVCWMLIVFYPFCSLVQLIVDEFGPSNLTERETFSLSMFHTMFNLCNTFLLVWFTNIIANIVTKIIPQKAEEDEEFRLRYIASSLSTSELSIFQAQKEIFVYAKRIQRMFGLVKSLYVETDEEKIIKLTERIQKYENISDRMEVEIANYLNKVSEGRLSNDGKNKVHRMLRIISEIESIADSCNNISQILDRKKINKITFNEDLNSNVNNMFGMIDDDLNEMFVVLNKINEPYIETSKSESIETQINRYRDELKNKNITDVNDQKYSYTTSVIYMDLITECEKMGDYIINVDEAVSEYKPVGNE